MRPNRSLAAALALSLLLAPSALADDTPKPASGDAPAAAAPAPSLDRLRADVLAAARGYDDAALDALVAQLETRTKAKDADLATRRLHLRAMFYRANLLRYRRTIQEHPKSSEFKDRQLALAEAGEELAEVLTKQHPDDVDLRVLHGEFIALRISGPNGAILGPRAATQIEKALELAPNDPDAHLASGRRYLYTPGAFGGSDEKGLEHLQEAEKTLNAKERDELAARRDKALEGVKDEKEKVARLRALVAEVREEVWGPYEEVLVQLAVVYRRQGRDRRARVALKRALAGNPASEAARLLLERLDKAGAK